MNLKKELKYTDTVIWICFGLMLLVKFCSIFLFVQIHEETGAEIESVATAYEANPLFKLIVNFRMIGFVLMMIILPASAMAFYYYMRRKVIAGKTSLDTLLFFVQFAFFALIINIVNDGAALLSKIAGG